MSAVTNVTIVRREKEFEKWRIEATCKLSTSYTAGGDVITAAQLGLVSLEKVVILNGQTGGYWIGFNGVTVNSAKIQAYAPSGTGTVAWPAGVPTVTIAGAPVVGEAVTVTTNAGTLAHTPESVNAVYATAAVSTGVKVVIPQGTSPAAGQVAVNYTTGVLTFYATDAVTAATVDYVTKTTSTTGTIAWPVGVPTISGTTGTSTEASGNMSTVTVQLLAWGY